MAVRKRTHFTGVWLSTTELRDVQNRTEKSEDHSHLLRRLLAYAVEHMPEGWSTQPTSPAENARLKSSR